MPADVPSYVPPSIVGAPLNFHWEGASDHIGPVETVTPLLDLLAGTTTTAQIAMCAGILSWGAWRLKGHVEVEHNFELAEAAFAYVVDWRYVDRDAGPRGKAPDQPPALSAMKQLNRFMRLGLNQDKYWDSYFQPVWETFHSAHIVRHILPNAMRSDFESWLATLVGRIKSHWAKPDEEFRRKDTFPNAKEREQFISRHRGRPVPREILDPRFEYQEEDSPRLIGEFLARLNPQTNRYLRSPENMLALGFEGVPYHFS
jgi:hypothetical protein